MKRNRLTAIAAAVLLLTGCGHSIGENESIPAPKSQTTTTAAPTSGAESEIETTTTTGDLSQAEKEIVPEEVVYEKFTKTLQAEKQELPEGLTVADERAGFSGTGYVSGFDPEHSLTVSVDIPESQYYNITAAVAADKKSTCTLTAGGALVGDFTVAKDGKFAIVTFKNIRLEKGSTDITFAVTKGAVDLDYIKAAASDAVKNLDYELKSPALSNKEADFNAQALYSYICECYGKSVITGQHDTVGTMTETRRISEITGRSPAIRFGDLMPFTQDMIIGEHEIEYAEKWAEEGGLISYMWHWIDPVGGKSYYADETDFELSKAVTKEKVYDKSIEELEKLQKKKKISAECVAVIKDIDKISEKLAELRDKGIAVLWRPLHEASNGYFWWGRDKESYIWLWTLLYQRQTEYHKLNNLIWVWSAQNSDWYVGDELCDVISADIYDQGNTSGQVEKLLFLRDICKTKPIAMSECGTLPSIQSIADERAYWSYIGQWGGSFLLNEDASLNEDYNTTEALVKFYSNNISVTRDELPDLKARAAELEKAAAEAEKEKQTTTAAEKDKDKDKETEKETTASAKKTTAKTTEATEKETTAKKTTKAS
ncbi:MAG: glycoside hydrolase [Ruminococcus sp.]|nr:glycoside hydrolase [Ruminococcus sp.]